MFNHRRLSLARRRRRLTGKRLAELVGVTPATITRLEKGHNEPEPETVDALTKALDFPKEFFAGDDFDELTKEATSFRGLTSMTAKEREAALAAGALAYMLADWVTDRFNLPDTDIIYLGYEADPPRAARILREHWGLGEQPVGNMVKLLESKGARVFSLTENTKTVDAFSCWRDDVPYIFLNTFKSAEHSRFDAAHELAHLVLHRHGGPHQGREAEREANSFASSFLMPKADVLAKIPYITSLKQLIQAKKRWRVSVAALAYRLHKIGLITDWQYRSLCIQINKRGYHKNEPECIQHEESVVWKKVFSELWAERITKKNIADDLHIPTDELEGLIFGLAGPTSPPSDLREGHEKPVLRLVKK